ncbi:hypothetical protein AM571_CH01699 [Rhizobium etli 8C-3]|uniref:HTH-type transcriptional regulator MT1864/Rv1816-like C-terminal domain-containing protein n=1 Tax=Rhizobium etli 8C-3 TaxID=538025 RepID=A0A1L5P2Z8_RHIET|nr:WHG domain-containing protein [Rhizobium etli]APO74523.1 hypothetical protein AM571_CH01699 [Rhizobium etli 8C-3]
MVTISATPGDPAFRKMAHEHVHWGLSYPNRFGLIFGRWERYDEELAQTANKTLRLFIESIAFLRRSGAIKPGDDERTAAMFMALMHGSIGMALSGHRSEDGKGQSDPQGLIDDLIEMLQSN